MINYLDAEMSTFGTSKKFSIALLSVRLHSKIPRLIEELYFLFKEEIEEFRKLNPRGHHMSLSESLVL